MWWMGESLHHSGLPDNIVSPRGYISPPSTAMSSEHASAPSITESYTEPQPPELRKTINLKFQQHFNFHQVSVQCAALPGFRRGSDFCLPGLAGLRI